MNPTQVNDDISLTEFEPPELEAGEFAKIASVKVPQVIRLQEDIPRKEVREESDEHRSSFGEDSKELQPKGQKDSPAPPIKNAAEGLKGL